MPDLTTVSILANLLILVMLTRPDHSRQYAVIRLHSPGEQAATYLHMRAGCHGHSAVLHAAGAGASTA